MKQPSSNKIIIALLFFIPLVIVIIVFFLAFRSLDDHRFNGPLAYPQDEVYKITSPTVHPNEGVVFGGLPFRNRSTEDIQVISIKPSNISSDMSYKVLGVAPGKLKSMTVDQYQATGLKLENVPFTVPAGSSKYQPIVELIPKKPGTYSIDGLFITYKYKGKLYRDFYPDQMTIRCQ